MTDSSSRQKSRYCYILNLGLITILLSACGDPGMVDLKNYVAEIKAKENPAVDKMPEYRHIPPYFYEVQNLRDPFKPLIDTKKRGDIRLGSEGSQGNEKKACPSPQSHRVRVGLELMPLDALQMVGTLEIDGTLWALVKSTGDGTIYRVKQGTYMGENYGQIINISELRIEVLEHLPDGKGCWKEEVASLSLAE
jgi:type IV pilus assembly protein PilP